MKRKKRQNRRQKQSRRTRPKPSRLPPHRPSQPRRLQKRNCPHNLQWKSRRNPQKQSPQKRRKNPKKQNRPRPLKRNRENQKHRKHPRSRNRQYQNQKPNLPRQRKHPAAELQPEEDAGLVDRIKAAVRADPVGYVRHLFSVLRASVGPLLRGFRVSKLNVIWTITGETAAETAILYGQTLTTLNTILAIAQDHIKIQADQLWLEADYTGSAKQQRVVSLKLLLCPLLALVTVLCFMWHAWHDPQLLPPKHPKYNTPETEQGGNL